MDAADRSFWDRMVERRLSRRALIKASAAVSLNAAIGAPLAGLASCRGSEQRRANGPRPLDLRRFTPIPPSRADELILPPEFAYRVLLRWGEPINDRRDRFGFSCDFGAFFPLGGARRRPVSAEGLYVVSHETPDPVFIPRIEDQKQSVGLSIVHLEREAGGEWRVRLRSPYARRYSGTSPARLTGPAAGLAGNGGTVTGTMGNCSGGVTPWGTVCSCEENTVEYGRRGASGFDWGEPYTRVEHYGWVVEVDPYDPESVPLKRTALGRFHHENTALRVAPDGRLAVYMGDDMHNGFVYKYVSEGRYDPARGLANGALLDRGRLHVAHCRADGTGAWMPLPMTEECLRDTHGWILERGLAATPMDRPEDLEVHPADGSVYVALTHNTLPAPGRVIPPLGPDPYGKIVRLMEAKDDPTASGFTWEVFAVGGPVAGFAAPDNLEFDRHGNLWMACDFPAGPGVYEPFGNTGLFMVPTRGARAGIAFQFASAPVAAELTGPCLAPDDTALFLSVQHPGEGSPSAEEPTSRWPDGEGVPLPSCVVITRRHGRQA